MSNEFKALAARVTELEDRLAKMKRYYEDALSNLDDSNFAVAVVKERNNMKAKITMTAEEIKTSVEKIDELGKTTSEISQTAEDIKTEVKRVDDKFSSYSTTNQTAELITTTVNATYVDGLIKNKYSTIEQTANNIGAAVTEIRGDLSEYAKLEVMNNAISSKVGIDFNGIVESDSAPGSNSNKTKVYKVGSTYYYWDGVEWSATQNYGIFSCFTQTSDGFKLKGDFSSTTNAETTVDISGTKIDILQGGTLAKLSMGFNKTGENATPFIKFGAGDGENHTDINGFDVYQEQGYIAKYGNGFNMIYYTDEGEFHGMFINRVGLDTSIDLRADNILFNGNSPTAVAVFG